MGSLCAWLLNFFLLVSVIGLIAHVLVTDLEFDYISPYDLASRINIVVMPEYLIQGLLCLTFLLTGHWFFCLLSLPNLNYNVRLFLWTAANGLD